MVKHLRFLFVSMLMLICGNAMADEVTFDFNNDIAAIFPTITSYSSGSNATYVADGEFNEDTTSPAFGGVTVTVTASPADAGTRNRLWASAPRLRMYDGTLTFTSSGEKITKIVFTRSTNDKLIANSNTADSGELTTSDQKSNGVVTWTGEAQSVTITIKGNTQFSKAVVTLGEGGETPPVDPNALGQQNNPYTVARAFEALGKLAVNVQSDEVYVKGKISKIDEVSVDNGNATYYISDDGSTNNQLYVYRGKFLKNADFTADDQIAVGDEVVVCGILVNYRSSKAAETDPATPEITQPNYIYMLNGKTEDDTPVTIEKAANISAFKALAENTVAELTLTDAKVLYKNVNGQNTELFIRDASGAMDLYNMGIKASAGQVLNGTIIGTRGANSGFTIAMKSHAKTNVATVTVSGTEGDVDAEDIGFDEAADNYCNYVVVKNVNVSEDKKNAINEDEEELPLYDRFKLSLLNNLKTDVKYDIYGLMYDGGETYGAELVVTKVTLAGGGEIVDDPATPVASIAALLDMENTNNIELTLTDAKVLFVDNNYIYVRENGKAICFYQISGLKEAAKNNSIINGKIQVDYEVYKLLPEVKSNKNTNLDGLNITESEEAALPVATTLAKIANGDNVCDLVSVTATLVKEVTYKEDGVTVQSTTYKLKDGDVEIVAINNSKNLNKIEEGTEITVVGIVNTDKNAYQIKLTKSVDTEGISTMATDNGKATIFNLAGQRVEKTVKGLYILNGKKVMVK